MRMSCNGCRVLRKGCSEKCSIKPCLQWIKSPAAQGNATVFLAKFYGRAGLFNLINAGPDHLRPDLCSMKLAGGATGLLLSGNWHLCQAAIEAVLSGSPISQVSADSLACTVSPPLKACDIRHVSKDENSAGSAAARDLHRVRKSKCRFNRAAVAKPRPRAASPHDDVDNADNAARVMWSWSHKEVVEEEVEGSPSRDSGLSQHVEPRRRGLECGDADSASVETVEAALIKVEEPADGSEVELELTLGLEPVLSTYWKAGPAVGADGTLINGSDNMKL